MRNTVYTAMLCIVFFFILADYSILAQSTLPASQRNEKITANWYDRAIFTGKSRKPSGKNILWYRESAKVWEEALPIGNGRLGAMVFGGCSDERIQFNESSLWDGYELDGNNPAALEALPEIQRLLFEGKNDEAVKIAGETMMGQPKGVKPYQSLGELWFDLPHLNAVNYVRSLDLATAIATVSYENNGTRYIRECFSSAVDDVIVLRIQSDKKTL